MNRHAYVIPCVDNSPTQYLAAFGYLFSVVVEDEYGIKDVVDFKNEFAARTYADSINLQNGEDNA